jgi:hypothetical protein
VFPAGGSVPNASILNYELETVANATTVPLGPTGGGDFFEFGITVRADGSGTDFIADVNGYYVPPRPFILESGQTLRGTWGAAAVATAAGQPLFAPFTFQFPLASAPAAPSTNIIFGNASTPTCPGTSANPEAFPGQLCVYVRSSNTSVVCIFAGGTGTCGSGDSFGATVFAISLDTGPFFARGTWAVTAP